MRKNLIDAYTYFPIVITFYVSLEAVILVYICIFFEWISWFELMWIQNGYDELNSCFSFDLLVITSFKLVVFKINLGNKLGIDLSKNSNKRKLSYSTWYRYFFILLKSIAVCAINRNGRYMFYQKDCWHGEKSQVNWKHCNRFHFKNIKLIVPESFLWNLKQTVM